MLQYSGIMLNKLIRRAHFFLILFAAILLPAAVVFAQNNDVYPIYQIESGDFLSLVAIRFGTTVQEIIDINNIANADTISIGDQIKIPSLKGLSGKLVTDAVQIGDTLSSVAIRSGMSAEDILRINHVASRSEFYIGKTIILVESEEASPYAPASSFAEGETLIEKAVQQNVNPAELKKINQLAGNWDRTDRQLVFIRSAEGSDATAQSITPLFTRLELRSLPLVQGETYVLEIDQAKNLDLSGSLAGAALRFFNDPETPDRKIAMIGIKADQTTGLSDISLRAVAEDGETFTLDQKILIEPGLFTYEVVSGVDAATLEDHSNDIDRQALEGVTETSPIRQWGTRMSYPVDEPYIASGFGNRRTYNNTDYKNYHTGLDFGVWTANNINIYAAADGKVLFCSELPIHGLHTIIDHGWGVYSTYSHQSQAVVTVGQEVKRGEVIGLIGNSGRSAGPHLHWEIRVNGIYVDPNTWLKTDFP